ncbi:hypothetical protein QOT17_005493 [Balamuthia mandrillaris]
MVFIPPDTTYEALEGTAGYMMNLPGLSEAPLECTRVMAGPVSCGYFFRPCIQHNNDSYPLPQQLCLDICLDSIKYCTEFALSIGITDLWQFFYVPPGVEKPVDCGPQEVDYWAQNVTLFANGTYSYFLPINSSSKEVRVECHKVMKRTDQVCQEPLHQENERCGFHCPLPAYSEEEYDALKVIQMVFGWISLAGSIMVIISYALSPKLRKFPANLIMMTCISAMIAAGAIILPTFGGSEVIWCGPDGQFITPSIIFRVGENDTEISEIVVVPFETEELETSDPLCTFQGFLLHWGFLSGTMWWHILFFASKTWPSQLKEVVLPIAYHLVAWGLSFLFAVIPAAAGKIVFAPGGTFCFLSSENDSAYILAFWIVPIGFLLVTGLVMALAAAYCLLSVGLRSNKAKDMLSTYLRLFCFIFFFFLLYAAIFTYTIHESGNWQDITRAWDQYFLCLYGELEASCELGEDASLFSVAMLRGLGYSSLGLALFLNFFFSRHNKKVWLQVCQQLTTMGSLSTHSSKKLQLDSIVNNSEKTTVNS